MTIPYSTIEQIHLKRSGSRCTLLIYPRSGNVVCITNRFYQTRYHYDDYSRAYAAFVRVLHYHLRERSTTHFRCGTPAGKVLGIATLLIALGLSIAFLMSVLHAGSSLLDWVFVAISALVGSLVVGRILWNRMMKAYTPDNVPLQYLPELL